MKTRITTSQETGCFNGWVDGVLIAQAQTKIQCYARLACFIAKTAMPGCKVYHSEKSITVLSDGVTDIEKTAKNAGIKLTAVEKNMAKNTVTLYV